MASASVSNANPGLYAKITNVFARNLVQRLTLYLAANHILMVVWNFALMKALGVLQSTLAKKVLAFVLFLALFLNNVCVDNHTQMAAVVHVKVELVQCVLLVKLV